MDALCRRVIRTFPKDQVPGEMICSGQCPLRAQLNDISFHAQACPGPLTTTSREARTQQKPSQQTSQGEGGELSLLHRPRFTVALLTNPRLSPFLRLPRAPRHHTRGSVAPNAAADASSGTRGTGTGGMLGEARSIPARATGRLCRCQFFFLF